MKNGLLNSLKYGCIAVVVAMFVTGSPSAGHANNNARPTANVANVLAEFGIENFGLPGNEDITEPSLQDPRYPRTKNCTARFYLNPGEQSSCLNHANDMCASTSDGADLCKTVRISNCHEGEGPQKVRCYKCETVDGRRQAVVKDCSEIPRDPQGSQQDGGDEGLAL